MPGIRADSHSVSSTSKTPMIASTNVRLIQSIVGKEGPTSVELWSDLKVQKRGQTP